MLNWCKEVWRSTNRLIVWVVVWVITFISIDFLVNWLDWLIIVMAVLYVRSVPTICGHFWSWFVVIWCPYLVEVRDPQQCPAEACDYTTSWRKNMKQHISQYHEDLLPEWWTSRKSSFHDWSNVSHLNKSLNVRSLKRNTEKSCTNRNTEKMFTKVTAGIFIKIRTETGSKWDLNFLWMRGGGLLHWLIWILFRFGNVGNAISETWSDAALQRRIYSTAADSLQNSHWTIA